jgi:hypothetical protein
MNTKNFKINGVRSTATKTVLDRTAMEVLATVANAGKNIKRRVTYKVDSGRVGVQDKTVESPKSAFVKPHALRPSSVARLPAKKTTRGVSKSASRGTHSQRYGSMESPWWLDDNVQTYMELMAERELQEKLRTRSRTTIRTRPIDRNSENHDLGVQPKDCHVRLKRKVKITVI